jgi:hypothetical protein
VPLLGPTGREPGQVVEIDVPAGSDREQITDARGRCVGEFERSWRALRGAVEVTVTPVRDRLLRIGVSVANTSPWPGGDREDALGQTFASTHIALHAEGGDFVSLTDPPEGLRREAAACRNEGTWPVLVGAPGDRSTLLSSPIILEDYARIAPESPGDLFDGGEIDQLLTLNILSLTDEEKREMRGTDARTREILERTEALSPEELMSLHGRVRELHAGPRAL